MRRETFYFFSHFSSVFQGTRRANFIFTTQQTDLMNKNSQEYITLLRFRFHRAMNIIFLFTVIVQNLDQHFFFSGRSILLLTLELPDCSDSENQIDFVNFIIVFKLSVDSVISYFLNVDGLTFSIPPMFVNGILALLFKILLFFNYSQH